MITRTYRLRTLLLAVFASTFVGCAFAPLAPYQPTFENTQLARQLSVNALSVGDFKLADGLPVRIDRSVNVRGSSTKAAGGSFAAYLRESLVAELKSGGKYAPDAPSKISGQLLESEVDAGIANTGRAVLAARFQVARSGAVVFDKLIRVTHEWESSFIGAIAIPRAFNEYNGMYRRLVSELLMDDEFRAAVAVE